ncbi:MAG: sigma-70 family RNA polymerase sigma factor [Candidatus Woesearchaeota archaeon]|jgi:RNA polymerase sporulation-specific sigma factor
MKKSPIGDATIGKEENDIFDLIKKIKYENNTTAFDEICKYMKPYIDMFCRKFVIAGLANDDIVQECLFALRYKAVDDFNPTRGKFKTFAVLCLKRHLFSIIKGNNQHKKKALNISVSIDSSHDAGNDELRLKNLIASDDLDVDEQIQKKEDQDSKKAKLICKLSDFEKAVFELYIERYRYEEIVEILNSRGMKVNRKGVDNSVQRCKFKARNLYENFDF